jgi:PAS domain S-box-containing protein
MTLSLDQIAQAFGTTPLWAWLILGTAFAFAVTAGVGALFAAKRARWVETLIGQRTTELAQINEKLAEEICDHLNTEHALDKEREALKAVLNNLHEGILVLDANGHMRIANGAALSIYSHVVGTELDRMDRLTPFDFYGTPDERRRSGDNWPHLRALAGETVRNFELTIDPPGGTSTTLNINAQPLFTSDGRQHGAVIVVRDITDSKKVERLKAEFVATVSHELRTPITSIRGSLGLIAAGTSGPLNEKTKHLIEIALRNSDRLGHLINDLLDIEKIESGHMRFELECQSLEQLVLLAIEANSGYAESFDVRLAFTPLEEDSLVYVDPYRLLQVLANLLSNAVKFAPAKSTVDLFIVKSGRHVRISVRDRGAGIPMEFHDRIFQKFSQADGSDARNRSGTGLGLSICKAIVEQMDGRIGFDTEMGKGTTFYFELPVDDQAAGKPAAGSWPNKELRVPGNSPLAAGQE